MMKVKLYITKIFSNEKINDIYRIYLDGLQWILDYYFNDVTYQRWFYIFNKSPLISDIYKYILKQDSDFFNNSKVALRNTDITSVTDELTPLEHFFYVTQTNDVKVLKNFLKVMKIKIKF